MTRKKLLMVSSGGGHLTHLLWYRQVWSEHDVVWVALPGADVASRLKDQTLIYAHGPTNRSPWNALKNARLARRLLREHRPDWVVSAGAGIAVPFLAAAHAYDIRTLFFEVCDRIERPSLSGRLLRPLLTKTVVFHPDQLKHYPNARLLQGPK